MMAKLQKKLDGILSALPAEHKVLETVKLPEPRYESPMSVEKALLGRRSVRTYSEEPITLAQISQLLWAAYGITKKMDTPAFLRGGFRTAASAGGLYPLELYVVAGNVKDLPAGIYCYKSDRHELALIARGDKRAELCEAGLGQPMIKNAAAVIVYSAIFERTTKKYGPRGRERYVWMDAGHSGQNLYLQAYALDLGMCVSGAFIDILVKKVIGMTKSEEPVYIVPVGKKKG
jgi:SagB-type dehydrogenase family enzyme